MTPDPVPPARRDEGELDKVERQLWERGEDDMLELIRRVRRLGREEGESAAFARGRAENNDDFVRQVARDLSEIAGIAWNPPEVKLRDLASAIEQRGYQRGIEEAAKVACWMCQLGDLPLVDGCHYLNDDLAKQRMSGVRCHGYPIRAMLGGGTGEGNRG